MLLTLTADAPDAATPASDLGHLLHKHPDRVQTFDAGVGTAHVLYPRADAERCTVALLVEVDPVGLVRDRAGRGDGPLAAYVNDVPYASASVLAVALRRVFGTAMTGRCDRRPELASRALPLEVHVPAVAVRGDVALVAELFAPLGWDVAATPLPLDPRVPAWGDSRYVDLRLRGTLRLADALSHLYVLLPALDGEKHYWVGEDEVDKLLRAGEAWLADHPRRDVVVHRYLRRSRPLAASALERLAEVEHVPADALDDAVAARPEDVDDTSAATSATTGTPTGTPADADADAVADDGPRTPALARLRVEAVHAALRAAGARTVVDLGCGEGVLLRELLADASFDRLLGVDVSHRALQVAARRLRLDRLPERQRARVDLAQSALTYLDDRLVGFDAAVLMEVVEHVDPPRLPALEQAVLGHARPGTLVVTTPNVEHNARYGLDDGHLRHHDHRFEWTRAQFRDWACAAAAAHGYDVTFGGVGDDDPDVGPPTQLAVLTRRPEVTS
ncbi:3' terminal RNA ribose 2'-O-methyltransferase Hen1 [Cellulomonas iranensis]|uniref:3' terminal RNA ribose 2'-O-methyltransferase Hen1 n=1 Tax=Cellulomonas iranensis TaxID=76862 RepID=UPI003D7EDC0E